MGKRLTDLPTINKDSDLTNTFNKLFKILGGKYRFIEVKTNIYTNVNKSKLTIINLVNLHLYTLIALNALFL